MLVPCISRLPAVMYSVICVFLFFYALCRIHVPARGAKRTPTLGERRVLLAARTYVKGSHSNLWL